jgi:DNA-binding SARP family transcriptional activator
LLRVRLVGAFAVVRDGTELGGAAVGSRKARALLKLLAVERTHVVSVERIIDALWPDGPPARPAENVASLVSRLRQSCGAAAIAGGREGYRLGAAPAVSVDLDDADQLVEEAQRRVDAGEPALALAAAGRALDLLSAGPVLADEPYADWAAPGRQEAATLLRRGRHLVARAALATGEAGPAQAAAEAAIAADPYDEVAHRDLMAALHAAGETGRALVAYATLSDLLADELGADPAAETRALHVAILRDERTGPPAPPAGGTAPEVLTGRTAELEVLRRAWSAAAAGDAGLLLVVGEAGIGKTACPPSSPAPPRPPAGSCSRPAATRRSGRCSSSRSSTR